MYADGLKQVLRGETYGDGVGKGTYGMGMGTGVLGMRRNLWGWGGYWKNKLSPCISLLNTKHIFVALVSFY